MLGSAILEVAIGITFVYLLVSVICSAVREGIEASLKTRAAYLERGIRELLHDVSGKGLAKSVYEHPLIYSLYSDVYVPGSRAKKPELLAKGGSLPSYIPTKNFATALLDIAARGPHTALASSPDAPAMTLENVRASILNIESEPVQRVMLTAIDAAQGSLDQARANLEAWYDSGMDRVSGWYKRSSQWIIFWIGLAVAVGLNINTVTIADYLYRDDVARAAIVARAEAAAADTSVITGGLAGAYDELGALHLPMGWSQGWGAPRRAGEAGAGGVWNVFFGPILGWLLTALAATFGAPFWFDLLNKMMVIRSTVKPREKSPEEGSEDRQPKTRTVTLKPAETGGVVVPAGAAMPTAAAAVAPAAAATGVPSGAPPQVVLEDACDVPIADVTPDEDLPAAEGGIA